MVTAGHCDALPAKTVSPSAPGLLIVPLLLALLTSLPGTAAVIVAAGAGEGFASANGPEGELRVFAQAVGGSYTPAATSGSAAATIRDTLTFAGPAVFHLNLSLDALTVGLDDGYAGIDFTISIKDYYVGFGADDPTRDQTIFQLSTSKSSYTGNEFEEYVIRAAIFDPLDPFNPDPQWD